ncbi:MAG: methyl-accepting chemotaxis protein, partial [Bradyrhizobium sp.]|nr:methyl-accepting chemotaxis protein [Bradyrhizobium sp.]
MGMSAHLAPQSRRGNFLTLRFRAKIFLGFAVVLAISAASIGFAYLGFEKVAAAVASYRASVSEADAARTIDRELISYQALARYFALTGKPEDEAAATAAQQSLLAAIDKSLAAASAAERRAQLGKLQAQFQTFAKIFSEIVNLTR